MASPVNDSPKRFQLIFWSLQAILLLGLVGGTFVYIWQQTRALRLPVLGTVPNFSLTERSGRPVTLADLHGKVWVADFVFTHCAGPCPLMSRHMASLQALLVPSHDVRLISFSVDPERDTPQVLTEYARKFGADPERWLFLTGDKKIIYELAQKGFTLVAGEIPPAERRPDEEAILHSTKFALVDGNGRIRGYYDSETPDPLKKLLLDTEKLLQEKSGP